MKNLKIITVITEIEMIEIIIIKVKIEKTGKINTVGIARIDIEMIETTIIKRVADMKQIDIIIVKIEVTKKITEIIENIVNVPDLDHEKEKDQGIMTQEDMNIEAKNIPVKKVMMIVILVDRRMRKKIKKLYYSKRQ